MNRNKLLETERTNLNFQLIPSFNVNAWAALIPIFIMVVVVMETKMVAGANLDLNLSCKSSSECGEGQICYIESGGYSGFCQMENESKLTSSGVEQLQNKGNKIDEEIKSEGAGTQTRFKRRMTGGKSGDSGISTTGSVKPMPGHEEESYGIPRILLRFLNALEQAQENYN